MVFRESRFTETTCAAAVMTAAVAVCMLMVLDLKAGCCACRSSCRTREYVCRTREYIYASYWFVLVVVGASDLRGRGVGVCSAYWF